MVAREGARDEWRRFISPSVSSAWFSTRYDIGPEEYAVTPYSLSCSITGKRQHHAGSLYIYTDRRYCQGCDGMVPTCRRRQRRTEITIDTTVNAFGAATVGVIAARQMYVSPRAHTGTVFSCGGGNRFHAQTNNDAWLRFRAMARGGVARHNTGDQIESRAERLGSPKVPSIQQGWYTTKSVRPRIIHLTCCATNDSYHHLPYRYGRLFVRIVYMGKLLK